MKSSVWIIRKQQMIHDRYISKLAIPCPFYKCRHAEPCPESIHIKSQSCSYIAGYSTFDSVRKKQQGRSLQTMMIIIKSIHFHSSFTSPHLTWLQTCCSVLHGEVVTSPGAQGNMEHGHPSHFW